MKPLRVLHLVDLFTVGGAEQLLPTLGVGLRRLGADPSFAALFEYPRSHVVDRLAAEGFTPTVVGLRGLRPDGLRTLRGFIARERPNVVHAHLTYASILGVAAAASLGVPSVVTLHQIGDVEPRRLSEAAREVVFRAVVGLKADRVISVSDAVARHYARRGIPRRKLRVVHNAIDAAPFQRTLQPEERNALLRELDIPAGARVLACVAMLRPGKGIGVLVRAMRAVLAREPRALLLVVGDGSERPRIEREVSALGLENSVRLLGTRADVPAILRLAELFILPTRSALSAFPTVLIEACASGLPSVASDVGGVPEIVRDGREGILTPVGDERALADAISTLLADHELRNRLADGALARASAFSLHAWASAVLGVYHDVTVGSCSPQASEPTSR